MVHPRRRRSKAGRERPAFAPPTRADLLGTRPRRRSAAVRALAAVMARSWRDGDRGRADHHRPGRRPRRRALGLRMVLERAGGSRSSRRPAMPSRPCGPFSGTSPRCWCSTSTCPVSSARLTPSTRGRGVARHACRHPHHAGGPGVRSAGAACGRGRLRAQGGRRRRARRCRAACRRGRHVPQSAPRCGARCGATRAFGAAGRSHRTRGRGPTAHRPWPHQREIAAELFLRCAPSSHIAPTSSRSSIVPPARSSFATRWTTGSSKPGRSAQRAAIARGPRFRRRRRGAR